VRLRLRDCVLDTGTRTITRDGMPLRLSPKAFRLLEVLVERRPNAVSHDELRDGVWPDTVAGGTTLARLVSELRAAIGDAGDGEPVIRTVHRFGYALSGAVDAGAGLGPAGLAPCAIRWGSQFVPLPPGEHVIGRAAGGLIVVPSSKVSRRHARLVVTGEQATIEDLGSRNGTYVGDRRIDTAVELKNGDRIGIGPALLIFCATPDDALTSLQSAP
jgi:DNA-binding winged helix-turn-helix (wHTH) protein